MYIYIYIHIHVFRPFQDSSVRLGSTNREKLMSPECSKHQVLSFAKMLVVWWTNKKYSVLISVLQSAQWINSERISTYTCFVLLLYIYKRIICPIFLFFSFEYGAFFDLAFLVCTKPSPNVTVVLHKENKRQLFKAYRKISTIAPFTKKKKGLKKVYKYFKNILQVVLVLKVLQKLLT